MNRAGQAVIVTVILVGLASGVAAQQGPATFFVDESRIDLGEIRAGTDAVATFTFRNTGEKDVRIIKAKPT